MEHLFPLRLFPSSVPDGCSRLFSCQQPDPSLCSRGCYSIMSPLCRRKVLSKIAFSGAGIAIVSKTIPANSFPPAAGWFLAAAGREGRSINRWSHRLPPLTPKCRLLSTLIWGGGGAPPARCAGRASCSHERHLFSRIAALQVTLCSPEEFV